MYLTYVPKAWPGAMPHPSLGVPPSTAAAPVAPAASVPSAPPASPVVPPSPAPSVPCTPELADPAPPLVPALPTPAVACAPVFADPAPPLVTPLPAPPLVAASPVLLAPLEVPAAPEVPAEPAPEQAVIDTHASKHAAAGSRDTNTGFDRRWCMPPSYHLSLLRCALCAPARVAQNSTLDVVRRSWGSSRSGIA